MLIDKLQACDDLEFLEAYTRELAGVAEVIPLGQGLAGVAAFEIIGGIEQGLAACLALAARERALRVATGRDRVVEPGYRGGGGSAGKECGETGSARCSF